MPVKRDAVKRSDCYVRAVRRWVPFLWKEPNALLAGSGWFLLSCLPLVTIAPAWLALTRYMRGRERGIAVGWREAARFALRGCGAGGWLMGVSDALALLMAGGCALAVFQEGMAFPVKMLYALLGSMDLLYLLSGMYRYPALNAEPEARLTSLIARSFLMALGNLGWTLLLFCAQLLAFMLCAATGVGLLFLFPAASALLAVCAYDAMLRQYTTEDMEEEGL